MSKVAMVAGSDRVRDSRSRSSTESWRRSEKQLRRQEVAAGTEGEQELGGHLAGITTIEVLQQQAEERKQDPAAFLPDLRPHSKASGGLICQTASCQHCLLTNSTPAMGRIWEGLLNLQHHHRMQSNSLHFHFFSSHLANTVLKAEWKHSRT